MKEIEIEELKQIQLDMLLAIHEFCIKNEICYSLVAGTLIGAIRHKGYIPWDDDIDICMTRPNYDKFLYTFNGFYKNLYVIAPELNWNYYAPYANVCDRRTILFEGSNGHRSVEIGVKIDIFPIDGISGNMIDYLNHCKEVYHLNKIMSVKRMLLSWRYPFPFLKLLVKKILYSIYSYEGIQKKIHNMSIKYGFNDMPFGALLTFEPYAFKVPWSVFDEYIEVDFEGYKLLAVKEYDWFLKLRYGDYMKLPPEEERVPHHGFTAYWRDNYIPNEK